MTKFQCRCSISDTVFVVMESQRPYSEWVEITDEINHTHYKNSFQSLQLVTFLFYVILFGLFYFISIRRTAIMNSKSDSERTVVK